MRPLDQKKKFRARMILKWSYNESHLAGKKLNDGGLVRTSGGDVLAIKPAT